MNYHRNYTKTMELSQEKFYNMSKRRRKKARAFVTENKMREDLFRRVWNLTWMDVA